MVSLIASAVALRNCIGSGLFLLLRDPLRALLPTSTSHWHNLYPVCSFVIAFVGLFVCGSFVGRLWVVCGLFVGCLWVICGLFVCLWVVCGSFEREE